MARSSAAAQPLQPGIRKHEKPELASAAPAESANNKVPHVERLIHEPIRLGMISALASAESMTFNELKRVLDTTDGNLSVHARKLEEAGYVECNKSFEGRMPKTEYRITADGRDAFTKYLDHMEALIRAMRAR